MWAVAGALLAAFVVLAVVGALAGPHLHAAAVVAGAAAAVALVIVALAEANSELAWALFGLDVAASAAVALSAWHGLRHAVPDGAAGPAALPSGVHPISGKTLLGTEAVAVGELSPEGVVRVHGEQWSAVSVNGPVRSGARVQVVGLDGIRLEVWNEEAGAQGLPGQDWPTGTDGQGVSR